MRILGLLLALTTMVVVEPLDLDVTVDADPATLATGRLAILEVSAPPGAAPITELRATLAGRRAIAASWSRDNRRWRLLAPIDVDGAAGIRELVVQGEREGGAAFELVRDLDVVEGSYDRREITVAKKFTSPSRAQAKRARAESRELDRILGARSSARHWRGSFARPTMSEETSPFGTLRTYNGARRSRHLGLDLDGEVGDPVAAAQAGRVVLAKDRFYSGGTVVIDHGEGLFTMYFHLSKIEVQRGTVVAKGELVGKVGSSGQVTGPHLHFSVRADGLYVDPKEVLNLDLSGDPLDVTPPAPPRSRQPDMPDHMSGRR